jgi:hypothetical protein
MLHTDSMQPRPSTIFYPICFSLSTQKLGAPHLMRQLRCRLGGRKSLMDNPRAPSSYRHLVNKLENHCALTNIKDEPNI